MNRHDIQLLQQVRGYPALTITLPTHRTSPDNQQDPIRVRDLVTEATNRLLEEFGRRKIDPLLSRLEGLVSEIDFRYTLDGVEEDFHYPATVAASGMHLSPADDSTAPGVMDDAADQIIEVVLSKQGRVVFVDNEQLAEHQRIALILRY
jgi:hypothetical protein